MYTPYTRNIVTLLRAKIMVVSHTFVCRAGGNIFIILLNLISMSYGAMNICLPLNNTNISELPSLLKQFESEMNSLMESNISDLRHVDKYEFNFTHPAISASGEFTDFDLLNMKEYNLKIFQLPTSGGFQIFNLTFTNITMVGSYNLKGNIGDLFDIFGEGKFWLSILNISVSADTSILSIKLNETAVCVPTVINIYIQNLQGFFDGLMDDEELSQLINKAIASVAPDAIRIIWNEAEGYLENNMETIINKIISDMIGKTFSKILTIYKTTDTALSQSLVNV